MAVPPFDITETRLPAGGLLVLDTDGLVVSPDRDIDDGMAALAPIVGSESRGRESRRTEGTGGPTTRTVCAPR
ncbi:hypothetical protein [Streptomyces sp. NBC_01803]|uniref:hypothetical protein n=1 Tax=Streptomyces sp. NBC_01803 TaxID=2975946 RepID=UPI002DDBCDAF|nr:hypothetical protein [Streptomyces sp. NBC_01803]WSA44323.1 hypothetical protein OIE51_08955 [Streptomyces sp. NBC_01803]